MKTLRRVLSLLMALTMVICLVPTSVLAYALTSTNYEIINTYSVELNDEGYYETELVDTEKVAVKDNEITVTVPQCKSSAATSDKILWTARALLGNCTNGTVLQEVYDVIYDGVEAGESEINVIDFEISINDLLTAYDAYSSDHSEHFWREPGFSYKTVQDQNGNTYAYSLLLDYYFADEALETAKTQFETSTNAILSGINSNMTEYEKEKYIYDQIAYSSSYDYDHMDVTDDEGFYNAHSAYGIIVNGTGVCEAYARAFQYLLNEVGIESLYVTGDANGAHAWNLVNIDDNWYYCDLTWDDSSATNAATMYYAYFNKDASSFTDDHIIEPTTSNGKTYYAYLPSCTSADASYFSMNADSTYDIVIDEEDLNLDLYDDIAYFRDHPLDDAIRFKFTCDETTLYNWLYSNLGAALGYYYDSCNFCYYNDNLTITYHNYGEVHGDISYDAITDKNNPITVSLINSSDEVVATTTCDKFDSSYSFYGISDGTYTLKAEKTGCNTATYEVTLSSEQTEVKQDIALTAGHVHSWNDGEVTTAPTCTTKGVKTYTCSICNGTKTEAISKLDHTFDQQVKTSAYLKSAATCTNDAVYFYSCSCGECGTATFVDEGTATGHSYVNGVCKYCNRPTTVTGVKATSVSAKSIKVTWTKMSGVTAYAIYRSTSSSGTYSRIGTVSSPSTTYYTDSSLSPNKTYYYKVRAYKTVNGTNLYSSSYSSYASAKTATPTVTGVKATSASYSSLKITWSKVSGASGYIIYRATSKSGTYKAIKTITSGSTVSYTNSSLTCGKTYYYKVRAYTTVSSTKYYGSYSSIISGKPVPKTPTLTVKKSASKKIKVSWTKVSGASGYEVYRATSKNGTYTLKKRITSGSTLSYTNTGLTSKKTYYYKVRAYRTVNGTRVYGSFCTVKYAKA